MQELFGNAPPSQLLILMALLLLVAVIFASVIVFLFARRSKKGYMNNRKVPSKTEETATPKPQDLNSNILSDSHENTAGLDMSLLSSSPVDTVKTIKKETAPMELSKKDNIDLGARLSGLQSTAPSPPAVTVSTPSDSEHIELMRLLRHPQTGQLIVEVDGQRYNKLAEIKDRKIGQYILELVAHLLAFTNGVIAKENGIKLVYNPKVGETPQPIITAPTLSMSKSGDGSLVPPPSPEAEAAFRASMQTQQKIEQPIQQTPIRLQGAGAFGFPKNIMITPPAIPTGLNLAEEINDIVQLNLINSPLASTTTIKITTAASGGINIRVNNNYYSSPDDISDPDVKTLIKNAIKIWERS